MVLMYAHPAEEYRARSVARLERFNAARQMEALVQDSGVALATIRQGSPIGAYVFEYRGPESEKN
jgi:hypothetical protein